MSIVNKVLFFDDFFYNKPNHYQTNIKEVLIMFRIWNTTMIHPVYPNILEYLIFKNKNIVLCILRYVILFLIALFRFPFPQIITLG